MAKTKFPTFDINDQQVATPSSHSITVDRFGKYLSGNPHLHTAHTHSFYHLVYFSKGKGSQLLDFVKVPVRPGIIYFMNPSQVHQWLFEGEVDGFIINFSPTYFEESLMSSQLIHRFPFFNGDIGDQVWQLNKKQQREVTVLFETMLQEQQRQNNDAAMMTASLLIQLFVTVNRVAGKNDQQKLADTRHQKLYRQFMQIVETHYKVKRLPKEYASILFVTPHQLNAITNEVAGISSGEIIRNRVVLEAKRLLINLSLSVEEIAAELNFTDSSYFVKFFKKYTGQTPFHFREAHQP